MKRTSKAKLNALCQKEDFESEENLTKIYSESLQRSLKNQTKVTAQMVFSNRLPVSIIHTPAMTPFEK